MILYYLQNIIILEIIYNKYLLKNNSHICYYF